MKCVRVCACIHTWNGFIEFCIVGTIHWKTQMKTVVCTACVVKNRFKNYFHDK